MLKWIEISQLRPGMHVQLELGWLSHPFPLSRFRISAADEIQTLRQLGLTRVQVNVALSDPGAFDGAAPIPTLTFTPNPAPFSHADATADSGLAPTVGAPHPAAPPVAAAATVRAPLSGASPPHLSLNPLADWEACEQRHARTLAQVKRLLTAAPSASADTAQQARQTVDDLLHDMGSAADVRVTLLSDPSGDGLALHSLNVTVLALLLGRTLGLAAGELQTLGMGALLHDMGKSALPAPLRFANRQFTPVQWRAHQSHVQHGVDMARRMALDDATIQVIAHHHEASNGSGYPEGLRGDAVGLPAKLLALVNAYDNLCNPGQRSAALTPHEALSLLYAQEAARHDKACLQALVHRIGVYPPGSLVQLSDDRYAMVMAIDERHPLKPQLLVQAPARPQTRGAAARSRLGHSSVVWLDLQTEPALSIRRSVAPRLLPPAVVAELAPRLRVSYFFDRHDPTPKPGEGHAWSACDAATAHARTLHPEQAGS